MAGPGHTGGDLVALLSDVFGNSRMSIECKTGNFTGTSRRYGLRIRYAANNAFTATVSYLLDGTQFGAAFTTERTFSRPNKIIPTDLKYEEFKYKEYNQVFTMDLPPNTTIDIAI
ncbi:delta endotoxin C-terminal domain-containing protein [Bacillus thuringiensis]|uniref:delta endotoxin C-terminal domain-containing protein n=1 Tax=Bacillus thuringiensis TaxID=1428 RepID=UPI001EDE4EC7|nr:delta endotoxin C-terminal domain-containing protein [Bacillus thuringiensis]MCG3426398.1 hypothetical protein [Bacillus thuringiensis]